VRLSSLNTRRITKNDFLIERKSFRKKHKEARLRENENMIKPTDEEENAISQMLILQQNRSAMGPLKKGEPSVTALERQKRKPMMRKKSITKANSKYVLKPLEVLQTQQRRRMMNVKARGEIVQTDADINPEKPYSQAFFDAYNLPTKAIGFGKERRFQCLTCQKCFNDSSNLKKHLMIHTG
jgi:hypothetical protein